MKYELLLRDIYKHTERAGLLQELPNMQDAIWVMKVSATIVRQSNECSISSGILTRRKMVSENEQTFGENAREDPHISIAMGNGG